MKVLAAVVLIAASASALGSGPYLPSGWRPDGPAFDLPARPPAVIRPQDFILQGSEASGSAFLREYGPPKLQTLPEVATEQSFVVLTAKFSEDKSDTDADAEVVEAATESFADLKYVAVEETSSATEIATVELATEVVQESEQLDVEGRSNQEIGASLAEEVENTQVETEGAEKIEQVGSVELKSINAEVKTELVEEVKSVEVEVKTVKEEVRSVEEETKTVKEEVQTVKEEVQTVEEEVRTVEEGVKNIAEAIVSLEKEIVGQEVQISQDLTRLKSVEQSTGLEQLPEGFLEYGPPGFREYGPPNVNIIPRTADNVKTENEKIENNETRRRRFSPKFKSNKARKH